MPVPNSFANVTTSIPLSQLDANFNTPITLGNTAIQLGNTVTTLNNMTLANVTVSSGNVTITNVTVTTANVTTANIATAQIANVTVSGTSTFAAGSNTAPSITFTGDTNTGIYSPGADTIAIGTGGTERLRVDSSGNVGVGTSSPLVRLDIGGSSTALLSNQTSAYAPSANSAANSFKLFNDSPTTGAYASLEFWVRNANANINIAYIASPSASSNDVGTLAFGRRTGVNTSAESMRLDANGNLGINTTSPNFGGVNKALTLNSATNTNCSYELGVNNVWQGSLYTDIATNSLNLRTIVNGPLTFGANNSEQVRITGSGLVGIGTPSPNYKLTIQDNSATAGTIDVLELFNGASSVSTVGMVFRTGANNVTAAIRNATTATNAAALTFLTNNGSALASRFSIISNGQATFQSVTANGAYLASESEVTLASNATINLTSATAGACIILVYQISSGDGGMFWANYTAAVTKIAGDGSATDAGTSFAVYKGAGSHLTTIRNRYGASRTFRIAVYSAQANP